MKFVLYLLLFWALMTASLICIIAGPLAVAYVLAAAALGLCVGYTIGEW